MKPNRLLQAYLGLNRNVRILGTAALLLLGGLAIFIAWRQFGDVFNKRERIFQNTINNIFFTNLIASGATTHQALKEVEDLFPYASGFIGLSRKKLTLREARELADRTGAEILDVAVTAQKSRKELTTWLTDNYPSQRGVTVWVRDNLATKGIDCPDVLEVTTPKTADAASSQPRLVFLRWPKTESWPNKGWSWTIQPQFDEVTPFSQWGFARVRSGKAWGVIDEAGQVVQPPAFDAIEPFEEQGSARVTKGDKCGLLDRTGKLLTPPEWEEVQHFINGFIPVKKDGKWGYLDATGKLVIPCEWEDAWRFSPEGFAIVTRKGKRGFIDRVGKVIVEPVWDGAVNFAKEDVGMVRRGKAWCLIDTKGELLCEPRYIDEWKNRRFDLGFLLMYSGATWSLLGIDGKVLSGSAETFVKQRNAAKAVEAHGKVPSLEDFGLRTGRIGKGYEGDYDQTRYHSRYGAEGSSTTIFDNTGKVVIPEVHARQSWRDSDPIPVGWIDDFIPYATPPKYGLINVTGKILAEPTWDEARILSPAWVWVRMGAKCGLADSTGKVVIAPAWDALEVLGVDWGTLAKDGKTILLDSSGTRILSPWVRVKDGEKTKILQINGQPAIPDTLPDATYVDFYGPAHVVIQQPDGQGGFVLSLLESATGQQTRFPEAAALRWNLEQASHGLLWMKDKATSRWRLMGRDGHDFQHSQPLEEKPDGWGFVEGRAALHQPDGWVVVDTTVKPISPDKWQATHDFSEGRAVVQREGKWGFIALDGQVVIPPVWDAVQDFSRGLAAVKKGDRWGYLDPQGKVAIEPVWDDAKSFRKWLGEPAPDHSEVSIDVAEVKINGAAALIDRNGRLIVDPQQARLDYDGDAVAAGKDSLIVVQRNNSAAVVPRMWEGVNSAYDDEGTNLGRGISPARAWKRSGPATEDTDSKWMLIDETGKALTSAKWSSPWYDRKADPLAGGFLTVRSKEQKYGLMQRDGTVVVEPRFDRIAWVAPKVAAVWSRDEGGLIDSSGAWLFRDDDKRRLARFGRNSKKTDPQFQHGLAVIEDTPKWGYARLNR